MIRWVSLALLAKKERKQFSRPNVATDRIEGDLLEIRVHRALIKVLTERIQQPGDAL